jgi:hypothetical protein
MCVLIFSTTFVLNISHSVKHRARFVKTVGIDLLVKYRLFYRIFNSLNAQLNPTCHLVALLGAHHIFHVSGLRVNE